MSVRSSPGVSLNVLWGDVTCSSFRLLDWLMKVTHLSERHDSYPLDDKSWESIGNTYVYQNAPSNVPNLLVDSLHPLLWVSPMNTLWKVIYSMIWRPALSITPFP